ncbi:hypothetical protein B0T22DRAFT_462807 [Podospora appendiculata]|uniref:C2H2-type domain-containing protein n=1 Tax=Podospora appendiculata TaxID=314037 RepID=A0AAE1CDS5_9PEZI|nr:hypothetical protein B0T22DRAFT_462807 [Podospora appendiculata]
MGYPSKRTKTKTRRYLRDIDQAKADLVSPRHLELYKETKLSEDLPGLGKFYCTACAKWFESDFSLTTHLKAKPHRRRLKALERPYTHEEANAVMGVGVDNGPVRETAMDVEMSS